MAGCSVDIYRYLNIYLNYSGEGESGAVLPWKREDTDAVSVHVMTGDQVSCDWRRAGHVTTIYSPLIGAGGRGGAGLHPQQGARELQLALQHAAGPGRGRPGTQPPPRQKIFQTRFIDCSLSLVSLCIQCQSTGCPAKLFPLGYLLFCRLLLMQIAKVGSFMKNSRNLLQDRHKNFEN